MQPHSLDAETGLLGCILLDAPRVLDMCAGKGVTAGMFYADAHRRIYAACMEMEDRHVPVDLFSLSDRLRDINDLDLIGGDAYLRQLVDRAPTVEYASHYIEVVLQKYILRALLEQVQNIAESCYASGDRDAQEILGNAEHAILEIGNFQTPAHAPWEQQVESVSEEIGRLLAMGGCVMTGLSTGFRDLDGILFGLQRSEMIVLAARPSMGKTSLAMNIAENVASGCNPLTGYGAPDRAPRSVGVFSMEMSTEALVRRMLCSRAGVSWSDVVQGYCDKDAERRLCAAATDLKKAKILVDETPGLDIPQLRARARRMWKTHGIELVVIDYLQLLKYTGKEGDNRQQETAAISSALKGMAKELRLPVLVLSQLNRQPEARDRGVPKLSDLRDSGSIEQDADVVMLLRRPIKHKNDPLRKDTDVDPRLAVVDVAKQRNGRVGEINLYFDDRLTRFSDAAPEGAEEGAARVRPSEGETDE